MSFLKNPRLRAAAPMFIDMAAPVVSFLVLHSIIGLSPALALSVGAAVAGVRTLYRAGRERRLNAFSIMMIVLLAATLLLVFITGDPRVVLAKAAVVPFVGGIYGIITNFVGRPLIFDVVAPFVTKGEPTLESAWEGCWEANPSFASRIRLLNSIWGVGFVISAVVRVAVIYSIPLNAAVIIGQIPTLLSLAILLFITKLLSPPLAAALRSRSAEAHQTPKHQVSTRR